VWWFQAPESVPAGDYRTSTSDVLLGLKNETLNKK
jgi:hypothetical protein